MTTFYYYFCGTISKSFNDSRNLLNPKNPVGNFTIILLILWRNSYLLSLFMYILIFLSIKKPDSYNFPLFSVKSYNLVNVTVLIGYFYLLVNFIIWLMFSFSYRYYLVNVIKNCQFSKQHHLSLLQPAIQKSGNKEPILPNSMIHFESGNICLTCSTFCCLSS